MQTIYCNWWDAEEPRTLVASGEWREKDKKRVNTEDTEEAQRTQRRVEEFKVEGSKGRAAAAPRNGRKAPKTKSRAKRKSKSAP
jgi:hypothetical protein